MAYDKIRSICPICGSECLEYVPFWGHLAIRYDCEKCGNFVLTSYIAHFLYVKYRDNILPTHQGTFYKNKTVQVLSNYINKYGAKMKNNGQLTWFYVDKFEKTETENLNYNYNFVDLCDLYGI